MQKLKELIGQVAEIDTKIAGVNADEAQFAQQRQQLIETGDYSPGTVKKITELDTRIAIVPAARGHLEKQRADLTAKVARELGVQRNAIQAEITKRVADTKAAICSALAPFATPETSEKLAERCEAVRTLVAADLDAAHFGSHATDDQVESARAFIEFAERFNSGKL